MEELKNLQNMAASAVDKFNTYDGKDFILPQVFKDKVKSINNNSITYNKYSAILETSGNQYGILNIYLPNQWFYIASYFTDYYNELQKYKKYALIVASKERLKELNGNTLNSTETDSLNSLNISEQSKLYLQKFITEYSWWGGAKTIDRGDFYVSPILSLAKLVNASQSFVAELCAFLSDKQDLVKAIIEGEADFETPNTNSPITHPLQQIYYGAPGTGKSYQVKKETKIWEEKNRVVRITFHPDSDYSTFVGAYKPTTESVQKYDIYNKPITRDGLPVMEQVITYQFVAQAFLHAYVNAWKNRHEPEFLIIEEINRGNCAQIFGDLFQLLDRGEDGYSEYPIMADKDLQKYLAEAFSKTEIDDYPTIKSGIQLCLPPNLYIRATMNTSDQSLFPIDSAFKRRWDWQYVPIAKGNSQGEELNWIVDVDGYEYDWWTFIRTINKHIFDTTNSEDKQLGFFFCKAKENVISSEQFVGKVIFYLWNDVFKNYGFDNPIFADTNDEFNTILSFDKFYRPNGTVNYNKIEMFFENLGLQPIEYTENEKENNSNISQQRSNKLPKYSIDGSIEIYTTPDAVEHIIRDFAQRNENMSQEEMIQFWNKISERNNCLVASWEPSPKDNQPFAQKRRCKIEWSNGIVWLTRGWTEQLFQKFINNVKQELNITIQKIN